ncbi:ABC transporter ATP-binding protein [Desulfospira joergensenii]|uniref:ABC transporter ATP-binding protein n=1 Tax=Desulfospira joergensenii TaxID=53329 RepID=UPI0003B4DAF5|nr:ABC transporter ATP-binding protein [Desulfospira joergensenii]
MLRLDRISKRFGALVAVDDVSFCLAQKGISGLIGPNGSGKTTLFHMITGFYPLDRGSIHFQDEKISGLAPHVISRKGIVRTFQQTRVLPFLSVLDNLIAAAPNQMGEDLIPLFFRPSKVAAQERKNMEKAVSVLETLELTRLTNSPAGDLSYGQQKLLEIGRVLMAEPRLIILDEPTAGINPSLIRRLVRILETLKDQGIKIFLIEHNMPLVSELCDEVFVMDSGNLIFSGPPHEVQKNKKVIEAYLGREA